MFSVLSFLFLPYPALPSSLHSFSTLLCVAIQVLGIPYNVETDGLQEYMEQFGKLEDCIVLKVMCAAVCGWGKSSRKRKKRQRRGGAGEGKGEGRIQSD